LSKKLEGAKIHFRRAFISQFGVLFKDKKTAFVTAIIIVFLSIIAGWIPDGLNEIVSALWFKEGNLTRGLFLLLSAVSTLFILSLWAYKSSGNLDYEIFSDEPNQKKVLIVFLSSFRGNSDTRKMLRSLIAKVRSLNSLEEKLEEVGSSSFKSWKMPLKAIDFHVPKLEKLIVITSPESSTYFPEFRHLVEAVFGEDIDITERKSSSFEDVRESFEIIKGIYEELSGRYKDRDIIVDITGGQKPVSIAGALITSHYPERKFQYVSTNDYSVKTYDVRLVSGD